VLLVVGALVDGQLVAKGKAPAADVADERLASRELWRSKRNRNRCRKVVPTTLTPPSPI